MSNPDLKGAMADLLDGEPTGGVDPGRALRAGHSARRARWAKAGVSVAVAAVLVAAVVPWALSAVHLRSDVEPVAPNPVTSQSPTPGVYALVADPFLTADEWAGFWGPGQPTTEGTIAVAPPVVRSATDPSRINCVGDAHSVEAQEVQSARYAVGANGGFNNEFILRYASGPAAAQALANLRGQFARCYSSQRDPGFLAPDRGYVLVAPKGPIDEMFEGEAPGRYQVYSARAGNVIVLVERGEEGWGDRTSVALKRLLDRALGPEWSQP
jgi:hypothetical protein